MAKYLITLTVDGARKEFVEKTLKTAFKEQEPVLYVVEKVDGSQISFGIVNDKLTVYSKSFKVEMDAAGMFSNAVTFLKGIEGIEERLQHLSVGTVIRGEKTSPESRSKRINDAASIMEDAKAIVEELKDEMKQWYDSIPENLQSGSKAEEVQSAIDALEDVQSEMESISFYSVKFPRMF
jgi:translation elongation factor EF-1beta